MRGRIVSTLFATAAAAGLAGTAAAQVTDPVVRYGQRLADPGEFYLNTEDAREVVRYSSPRDVRLCLPRNAGVDQRAVEDVPVTVAWGGYRATLYPGNCLYFDAQRVMVSPAKPLPNGQTIHGTIEAGATGG
ncbi:MAG: hypothetical protein GC203_21270 [Phenylobacterium sp.]|uniref:hypothetical protein n=1 Tax=Phenylobacterium sp. TaxID=1871053 RepID=UPI0025D95A35|nr:hypothetical protein [Phenylobacterium sp.]MBI1200399.1 hypothetical protein [Phenylobacterium sp.]